MILKNEKQIIRHQYTIIELLVVLVIAGLLTGMSLSGLKGALARQGATGAVRTLATKISMAQSFAVSKNRYVALLIPDYDGVNIEEEASKNSVSDKTEASDWNNFSSCFVKNRLCYVEKIIDSTDKDGDGKTDDYIYNFVRWVNGYEWQTLPSKTVAFVSQRTSPLTSAPSQVLDVPDPTHPDDPPTEFEKSTALIFKPSGALIGSKNIIVRIFRAAYLPGTTTTNFVWQGTENENKGWKIVINGFTGRSRFYLGGETVDD